MRASDDRDEALAKATEAAAVASTNSSSDIQVTVTIVHAFSCEARAGVLTDLATSRSCMLNARLFTGGRRAEFTTNDLSPGNIRRLTGRAAGAATLVADDPCAGLPDVYADGVVTDADLDTVADDVIVAGNESKIRESLEMERLAREGDPRAITPCSAGTSDQIVTIALVNTRGFRGVTQGTSVGRSAVATILDGSTKRTGQYATRARGWSAAEPLAMVAQGSLQSAFVYSNARRPATGRAAVIFDRRAATSVLADLFSAVNAANVASGNSWLVDRLGDRVGSGMANVVDDGRLCGGLGSAPFDGEGTATQRTIVMEDGVLRSYVSDVYFGRRLGISSTGNSANGSVFPNNFYLQQGEATLEELVSSTVRGILVLDVSRFSAGSASGSYSAAARGIFIEDGAFRYPVEQFTIASTLPDMLGAIDAVANDNRFDGVISAPSFRVAEMAIGGTASGG